MSINESFLAIVNPAAGGGRCGKRFPEALAQLKAAGLNVDVALTSRAGEGSEIARQAWAEGRRHFIAVGGDGTSYEIVNGVFPAAATAPEAERPTLGFLPLGTGNSFLRDFTTEGAAYSMKALAEGTRRDCDVVKLTCREGTIYYINILSYGFTADVGALTNRRFKALGEVGYVMAVITRTAMLKPKSFPMSVEGGVMEREPRLFVSLNNSRYTGGKMLMAPHASVSDGKVAIVEVGKMGRIGLLRTFPKIFDGKHVESPSVYTSEATRIVFDIDSAIDLMVDGEIVTMQPERLDVLHGVLRVCA